MKTCTTCKVEKPYKKFHKDSYAKDGLHSRCIKCRKKHEIPKDYRAVYINNNEWRLKQLYHAAKARAKRKNLDFDLTVEDVLEMYPKKGCCPVFGFKFEWGTRQERDKSPSIDRIDSTKGYVKDNCQIISWKANRIKCNFTLEDLQTVVDFLGG